MSVTNGNGKQQRRKIVVEDRGKVVVQITAGGPEIELDIVAAWNRWVPLENQFHTAPDGSIPNEVLPAYAEAQRAFVKSIMVEAAGTNEADRAEMERECQKLSLGGALRFIKLLSDEMKVLRDFFAPSSSDARSSPENTELTFST